MSLSRPELILALDRAGFYVGAWQLDDLTYETLSPAFVEDAWADWVASLPDELKESRHIGGGKYVMCPKWIAEVNDCDNIARDFAVFLDRCMAVDAVRRGTTRGNTAAGKMNLWRDGDRSQNHAVNWFVDHDGVAHAFDAGTADTSARSTVELPTISGGESI